MSAVIEVALEMVLTVFAELFWPLLYYTGWIVLKVITLGSYPPKQHSISPFTSVDHSRSFVKAVGIIAWLAIIIALIFN